MGIDYGYHTAGSGNADCHPEKKAKAEGLDIPNEVMLYIANQIDSNIRELEGALIRVVAYSSLINKDINADLVQKH